MKFAPVQSREDALRLALAGSTTLEEVLRVTPEDPDFSTAELIDRVLMRAAKAH